MSGIDPRLLVAEVERRNKLRAQAEVTCRHIEAELFKQQLNFIRNEAKRKAAICTRRAGKTEMWPRLAVMTALRKPNGLVRIWGSSRLRAKELQWKALQDVCARHRVPVKAHDTELTLTFENGAIIRLVGADKDKDVEKKRGDKTDLEIVLEAQLHGSRLKKLVEDVIEPCLLDTMGTLCLEGTPHPVCAGYWFHVTGENGGSEWVSAGATDGTGAGWQCFHWSVLDNPHMKHARAELAAMKIRKRWADDNPTYVREWLGRWVRDDQAMFYRYDALRNSYDASKVQPWGPGWNHVLGWDLGSLDDMALVVWAWRDSDPNLYEAFSWKEPGASTTQVMSQIDALVKRGFNFVHMVADTGGGGRMYVEETMRRYSYQFEPAKKSQKYEHVRLLNDDLLTGHVLTLPGSPLSVEYSELPRDPDTEPTEEPKEHPSFANHCCDAGLYAHRRAYHYTHEEEPEKPKKGTPEYDRELEAEFEQQAIDSLTKEGQLIEDDSLDSLDGGFT